MAMKPPGGDCHDLWGAEFKGSPCHHRVLKPPGGGSSDIFGAADNDQSPRRVRSQNQFQSSMFGPVSNGNETPARNKPDGNPVTGEGYSNTNGEAKDNSPSLSNGTVSAHSAPPQRTRVPPGGFSSGLW